MHRAVTAPSGPHQQEAGATRSCRQSGDQLQGPGCPSGARACKAAPLPGLLSGCGPFRCSPRRAVGRRRRRARLSSPALAGGAGSLHSVPGVSSATRRREGAPPSTQLFLELGLEGMWAGSGPWLPSRTQSAGLCNPTARARAPAPAGTQSRGSRWRRLALPNGGRMLGEAGYQLLHRPG